MKFPKILRSHIWVLPFILLMGCDKVDTKKPNSKVSLAFQSIFHNAKNVTWENEGEEGWEAHFFLNKIEHFASFDNMGRWLETEREIKPDQVPKLVLKAFNADHVENDITSVFEELSLEDARGLQLLYEFKLKNGNQEFEIEFDNNGNKIIDDDDDDEQNDKDERNEENQESQVS